MRQINEMKAAMLNEVKSNAEAASLFSMQQMTRGFPDCTAAINVIKVIMQCCCRKSYLGYHAAEGTKRQKCSLGLCLIYLGSLTCLMCWGYERQWQMTEVQGGSVFWFCASGKG